MGRTVVRSALAALMATAASGVGAGDAPADAAVSIDDAIVRVTVLATSGSDGDHDIVVEPYGEGYSTAGGDAERFGWRVRQQALGNPPFRTADPDCRINPVANDVVCIDAHSGADIRMGDGDDDVFIRDVQSGIQQRPTCRVGIVTGTAHVDLGPGADMLRHEDADEEDPCPDFATAQAGVLYMRLSARGGDGRDVLNGSGRDDDLHGESGNDLLLAGGGEDVLRGGAGADILFGHGDNDTLLSDSGGDFVDGGPGRDLMSYAIVAQPVFVDLGDDAAQDGTTGEGDDVKATVEDLAGGRGNDILVGSSANNRISGGLGDDKLSGRVGRDTLVGGPGRDDLSGEEGDDVLQPGAGGQVLDGGAGADTASWLGESGAVTVDLVARVSSLAGEPAANLLNVENVTGGFGADEIAGDDGNNVLLGGGGNDRIDGGLGLNTIAGGQGNDQLRSPSGDFDRFSAGAGDDHVVTRAGGAGDSVFCGDGFDVVELDLSDPEPDIDCEEVRRFPVDDGPPARVRGRKLRTGRSRLTIACPRNARVRCKGELVVRTADGSQPGRELDRAAYGVDLGEAEEVAVRLPPRRLGAARRVTVTLTETGASARGPRSSTSVLRVRRR